MHSDSRCTLILSQPLINLVATVCVICRSSPDVSHYNYMTERNVAHLQTNEQNAEKNTARQGPASRLVFKGPASQLMTWPQQSSA